MAGIAASAAEIVNDLTELWNGWYHKIIAGEGAFPLCQSRTRFKRERSAGSVFLELTTHPAISPSALALPLFSASQDPFRSMMPDSKKAILRLESGIVHYGGSII